MPRRPSAWGRSPRRSHQQENGGENVSPANNGTAGGRGGRANRAASGTGEDFTDDGFFSEIGGGSPGGLPHPYYDDNPLSYRDEYARATSHRDLASNFGTSTIGTEEYDAVDEIARLYLICDNALPRGDDQDTYQLETAWDSIREWLTAHPSSHERQLAATYQGHYNTSALHLVCKLLDPPLDIVRALISCSPETVHWPDSNGWLPLHHACANGSSREVLAILIDSFPQGKVMRDLKQRTPLHFTFFRPDVAKFEGGTEGDGPEGDGSAENVANNGEGGGGSSIADIVRLLSDSGAARLADEVGMLPMHYACAYGASTSVLRVLASAYPDSIVAREARGRSPLHLTMVNAHRPTSPTVLRFLVENGAQRGIVNIPDKDGRLPLYALAHASVRLTDSDRVIVAKCLKLYLDAGPDASADFLNAMQALPEWLRDDAVINSHVQDVLNAKIVRRFPTAILMLDFYALVTLIFCFGFSSAEYIKFALQNDFDSNRMFVCALLQFVCGSYFLLREAVQVVALVNLGSFSSWLYAGENWLDMFVIGFTIANSALMLSDEPIEAVRASRLLTVTQIVLWGALINYVRTINIGFAVFVGGLFNVARSLGYFILCAVIFIVAFAMMFEIIYSGTELCVVNATDPNNTFFVYHQGQCYTDFPHCDFGGSLLKVYTMMMGEIGEDCRYTYQPEVLRTIDNTTGDNAGNVDNTETYPDVMHASRVGSTVYAIYAFIIVIILSNVLIAVVTDSYSVVQNERSAMVFWSNRLDFVAETDAIANFIRGVMFCYRKRDGGKDVPGSGGGVAGAPSAVQEVPGGAGIAIAREQHPPGSASAATGDTIGTPFRDFWSAVTSLFDPDLFREMEIHPGMVEFWFYVFLMFVAVIIIPVWIIAGIATVGILWPPQVRRLLFFAKQSSSASRKDVAEEFQNEVETVKKGMVQLKLDLGGELEIERLKLLGRKDEIAGEQRDLMLDLTQLKEILTSLRESVKEKIREREERAIAAAQNS